MIALFSATASDKGPSGFDYEERQDISETLVLVRKIKSLHKKVRKESQEALKHLASAPVKTLSILSIFICTLFFK